MFSIFILSNGEQKVRVFRRYNEGRGRSHVGRGRPWRGPRDLHTTDAQYTNFYLSYTCENLYRVFLDTSQTHIQTQSILNFNQIQRFLKQFKQKTRLRSESMY